MILLSLTEGGSHYTVKAEGHSKDNIVCAGVSALLETWRLAEKALEQQDIAYGDGLVEAQVPKTETSAVLFTSLCIGLKALQAKYPQDIMLTIGG